MASEIKGAAFERSGSITKSTPCNGPGSTRHVLLAESTVTVAPKSRSICTVISICGIEGSAPPECLTVIPLLMLGATSKSADKNWLDALASMVSSPPGIAPFDFKTIGSE